MTARVSEHQERVRAAPESGIPRFDVKIANGTYINPLSGRTGSYKQFSHILLENPRSAYEIELINKLKVSN
jgi:hypothetical protein